MRSETGWLCFALLCFVLFCLHVVSCFGVVGSHTINFSFIQFTVTEDSRLFIAKVEWPGIWGFRWNKPDTREDHT